MGGGPDVALVVHPHRDPGEVLDAIGHRVASHGSRLLMRAEDAGRWDGEAIVVSDAELAARADAVLALGGDGTMLGALRLVARRPVPVLGVNIGSLGFLVEVQPAELHDALDRLERQEFTIEEHNALWLGADDEAVAFNDLAFVRVPGDGVVEAALAVGGQRMRPLPLRRPGRFDVDRLYRLRVLGWRACRFARAQRGRRRGAGPVGGHQPADGHGRRRADPAHVAGEQRMSGDRGRRHDAASAPNRARRSTCG